MPIQYYVVLHVLGIILTFMALGAAALHAGNAPRASGPEGGDTRETNPGRKLVAAVHGVGLLLILVAGFGMLAKKFGGGLPGWVHPKLLIWLLLGAAPVLIARKPGSARLMWILLPLLGAVAAYLGVNHP
jgi:hypothetical protein